MQKIGFIGFGSMGSVMIKALLNTGVIREEEVIVTTRTREKLNDFMKRYPRVEIASSVTRLAAKCKRVFICTGTYDVKGVLVELANCLPPDAHVITITGNIEIKAVESIFAGKVTKIMPTQLCEIREGVTLVCHNSRVLPQDKEFIDLAFRALGKVKEIEESEFDLGADLSSCAPAFFASILRNLADVAKRHGELTYTELMDIMIPTCFGTARLMKEYSVKPNDLISRVATKGGISEEGVKILDAELPGVFDELLNVTLGKRELTRKRIREQYNLG